MLTLQTTYTPIRLGTNFVLTSSDVSATFAQTDDAIGNYIGPLEYGIHDH